MSSPCARIGRMTRYLLAAFELGEAKEGEEAAEEKVCAEVHKLREQSMQILRGCAAALARPPAPAPSARARLTASSTVARSHQMRHFAHPEILGRARCTHSSNNQVPQLLRIYGEVLGNFGAVCSHARTRCAGI